MSLDGLSGIIDSATASVNKGISAIDGAVSDIASGASNFLSQGPVDALTSIGSTITGAIGALSTLFSPVSGIKLPLKNPLFDYASYSYVLGISVLTHDDLNFPDKSYMAGKRLDIICKDANADPKNRIRTAYGQFDFFIDNLEINCSVGMGQGENSNMLSGSFTITEPYSMGMFLLTIQAAAEKAGWVNYLQAAYLLTIEFRGNTETGKIVNIPNTSRKIPFRFLEVGMNVSEKGSVYRCTMAHASAEAHASDNKALKTDASATGATVQEVLQTGTKSLQVAINKRLKSLEANKTVAIADQVLILFPTDYSSSGSTSNSGETEDNTSATSSTTGSFDDIAKQLKVKVSDKNATYVQGDDCNEIGKASLGYDDIKKALAPVGKENTMFDKNTKTFVRANNQVDQKVSDHKFSQDSSIINAINQVILNSEYAKKSLKAGATTEDGFRKWWRIDTQVFVLSTKSNASKTGSHPKLIVYRVVPYEAHSSNVSAPNTKPKGLDKVRKQVVKQYDYIYTGKNVDIINFNLQFDFNYAAAGDATLPTTTQDNKAKENQSVTEAPALLNKAIPEGNAPQKLSGSLPTMVKNTITERKTDRFGGGGMETQETRAAKAFHDSMTNEAAMLKLEMTILGDPYYIAQSGAGNYTSKSTQYKNLNKDMTINYQNGEVHIIVNFRNPFDINQSTGVYDFKGKSGAPTLAWSGLYKVFDITSKFSKGQFTQVITGNKIPMEELKGPGTDKGSITTNNASKDPNDPEGTGTPNTTVVQQSTPEPVTITNPTGSSAPNDGWGEG
jgi:hypothetical protein